MVKLICNTISEYNLIDGDQNIIDWAHINNLVYMQEQDGLHCGTKIRRRHINFSREKMKVKLAVQVLSKSTSDALS